MIVYIAVFILGAIAGVLAFIAYVMREWLNQ